MAAPAFSVSAQHSARLADPALREALLKYARRRLPPTEVDDLVQNTLTDALVSQNPPHDEREFQRWVHGIARHKVADLYRRRGRNPLLDAELDGKVGTSDPGPATGELSQWIERELPKTDGAQATLHWLLRESDGESLDEIARDEAMPAPRVRQRVSRLRRHLYARWMTLGAAGLALLLCAGVALHVWRAQTKAVIAKDIAPSVHTALPTPSGPDTAPSAAPGLPAGSSPPQSKFAPNAKSVQSNSVVLPIIKPSPSKKLAPKQKAVPKPVLKTAPKTAPNQYVPSKAGLSQKSNFDDLPLQKQ